MKSQGCAPRSNQVSVFTQSLSELIVAQAEGKLLIVLLSIVGKNLKEHIGTIGFTLNGHRQAIFQTYRARVFQLRIWAYPSSVA